MTPAEYNDTVNLVKERYSRFEVDFKQAEQIHLFEQEKDLHSGNYFFSFWEEQDYPYDRFKKILDEQQISTSIKD